MKPSLVSNALFVFLAISLLASPVSADTVDELKAKIRDTNATLEALQQEIAKYEQELEQVGAARKTLETEITRLDASRRKLTAEISVTQNRIATASFTLEELAEGIETNGRRIESSRSTIGRSLREIGELDQVTFAEQLLSREDFSSAWEEVDRLHAVQSALGDEIVALGNARLALQENQAAVAAEQGKLVSYRKELTGQKSVLDQNRSTQASVLSETKNKESTFQTILSEQKSAAQALQQEINDYEARLEYTFDPSKVPSPGQGILIFPLDQGYMGKCPGKQSVYKNIYCITQYFGNTPFAQSGAYRGAGHNGIDFGAPEGTKVIAALGGSVVATGNTDLVTGCYSFGKWVMLKHGNGLASVYAHLSYVGVSAGESVQTGQFLGYSGETGYATGPHLHFGLYVADAVRIVRLGDIKAITNCREALVPIAPTAAYLNPIQYL